MLTITKHLIHGYQHKLAGEAMDAEPVSLLAMRDVESPFGDVTAVYVGEEINRPDPRRFVIELWPSQSTSSVGSVSFAAAFGEWPEGEHVGRVEFESLGVGT